MHKSTKNTPLQQCCFLVNQITLLTDAGLSVKSRISLDWRLKLDTKRHLTTLYFTPPIHYVLTTILKYREHNFIIQNDYKIVSSNNICQLNVNDNVNIEFI